MRLRPVSLSCLILSLAFACAFSGASLAKAPGADLKELGALYDVRILRDTWGVPHIFGRTDRDTAFGLGYAHSEDDLKHIAEILLISRGQLGTREAMEGVVVDYMFHLLRVGDLVDAKYETDLSPETRAVCEGYADGVNYYCALHPDRAPEDLLPVEGKDLIRGFVMMTPFFFDLPDVLAELRKEDGEAAFLADISPRYAMDIPAESHGLGSNTFALGRGRSADGCVRLAINSHQPWTGPVAWYEAHLHSEEGWDMVGSLFPGSPVILHGHNRHLGWAHTVNNPDLVDVYLLETDDEHPNQYRYDGAWYDFDLRQAKIILGMGAGKGTTLERECLWSQHHGPVMRTPKGCFAIRYGGMEQIRQIEQWYKMNKATDFDEFMDALRIRGVASFNIGYADKDGNIYYIYNASLPVRAEGYDWSGTVPGNTSKTLWTEIMPLEDLPQVLNPECGFIQNCNSAPFQTTFGPGNPDPSDFPKCCGIETMMSNRALRALELFSGDDSVTREEFVRYKYDMRYSEKSMVMEALREILALPKKDKLVKKALKVIEKWDLSADPDNPSAAMAILVLEPIVRAQIYGRPKPDVLKTVKERASILKEAFGRLDVPWKEVNRLVRGELSLGLGGGPDCLHAVYGKGPDEGGRLKGIAGDSYVLLVEWDPEGRVHSQSIHQFGSATTDTESPHYADQAPLFAQRKLKDVWMDLDTIKEHLEREYRPGEE